MTLKTRQLTTYKAKDFSPTFSPDGSLIAFVCGEIDDSGENLEIYLMDKDGQNRRRITNRPGTDRYVSWSPDGKYLIYTCSHPATTGERLMIMDLEKIKSSKVDFDRTPLEEEVDAYIKCSGVFCLLPEQLVRKTYPDSYFGTERFPDWKY
jgi:Tol biopolymer transport system component